jgi:hypothetical protein
VTDNTILDEGEEDSSGLIQESFEYRALLTLFWLGWSVWSFYEGSIILDFVLNPPRGLFPLFFYTIGMVYEDYFIGVLSLGMAVIVFKQSENRVFYLFSFLGIRLFLWFDLVIDTGTMLVFVPMFVFFFLRNFKACLICYVLSYLLLFVLTLNSTLNHIISLFTNSIFLLFCALLFMTVFSYGRRLFPLSQVTVKLRYRLYTLLGLLPSILERLL